jgi:hypothetical protein
MVVTEDRTINKPQSCPQEVYSLLEVLTRKQNLTNQHDKYNKGLYTGDYCKTTHGELKTTHGDCCPLSTSPSLGQMTSSEHQPSIAITT